MKVIYDISLLGKAYQDPFYRTGTFRVVENLAYELAAARELDLAFCISGSLQTLGASSEYLSHSPKLEEVPLIHTSRQKSIGNKFYSLNQQLDRLAKYPTQFRVLKKILNTTVHATGSFFPSLSSDLLAGADIFHSPASPLPRAAETSRGMKRFLTIHDLIPILMPQFFPRGESSLQRVIQSLEPEDYVICVSQSTKNDLCSYLTSLDPNRVFVTHLAAAQDVFYPCLDATVTSAVRQKYNIPDVPYILSLCTFEPRKNITHVIQCFAKLIQEQNIQDLYLVLVGTKGWHYDEIFEQLSRFDLAKRRVVLTGYVADEDLAALYSQALAFAYLSFYEGFGLPPLEAMQCGTPVITSNTSSLSEVVGDAGIMLSPSDMDGLCESMLKLYSHSSLRKQMSRSSIEQAKNFSWKKCIQDTKIAYKAALSQ